MTIAKEVVYALHQRLKDLAVDASPDKIAYLAKALESIAGQSTVLDIVQMTDDKLKELLDAATKHLNDLKTNKESSLSAITTAKTESVDEINTLKTESLSALKTSSDSHISLLDTRKDANVAAINSIFGTINDVPSGSSIMKEMKNRNMIEPGALPFLFGVLSRYNDYGAWGHGGFTTELGKWYKDIANTNHMLSLLAGTHAYDTSYVAFYRPPRIYPLQGSKGTFIYKEMYARYAQDYNMANYPYALLGVIFVKNTTNSNVTRTLNFVGSSGNYNTAEYAGAGLFIGTPDNINSDKANISAITWTNVYNYNSKGHAISNSGSTIIPANKTVAVLFYTTPYYHANTSSYFNQFMQWGVYNFRSDFLTTGLEVDVERTLRAWQCPGLENTYEIWK